MTVSIPLLQISPPTKIALAKIALEEVNKFDLVTTDLDNEVLTKGNEIKTSDLGGYPPGG